MAKTNGQMMSCFLWYVCKSKVYLAKVPIDCWAIIIGTYSHYGFLMAKLSTSKHNDFHY